MRRGSPAWNTSQTPSREQADLYTLNRGVASPRALPLETSSSGLEDPPKLIRFNSRHNPQPDTWATRPSEHGVGEGKGRFLYYQDSPPLMQIP